MRRRPGPRPAPSADPSVVTACTRTVGQLQPHLLGTDRRLQLVGRALGDDPAAVEHADEVGEAVGLLEVLGGEQDGHALGLELAHGRPDLLPAAGVEPGRGLVEEEQPRSLDHAHRQVEAALHPARVGPGPSPGSVDEVELVEQLGRPVPGSRCRELAQPRHHQQVLRTGEDVVDSGVLPGEADRAPDRIGLGDEVVPGDQGGAARRVGPGSRGSGPAWSCRRRWDRAARRWCRS